MATSSPRNTAPSSGELYGREDRDPSPSPNAAVTQASLEEMAFPRDDKESKTDSIKPEGNPNPNAYPVQVRSVAPKWLIHCYHRFRHRGGLCCWVPVTFRLMPARQR
jgi:hypothetical protein